MAPHVLFISAFVVHAAAQEEDDQSNVETAVSVMLLGSISFMMSLFYLVNHPDDDMQRYSWQVISSTISIFCSVLIFQGWNGVVEEFVIKLYPNPYWEVFVDMTQMVLWFLLLQVVLALASGAVIWKPKNGLEEVELNMKCWATLFAHISGFASINSLGSWQHLPWFSQTPMHALCVIPLGFLGLITLYGFFHYIRVKVSLRGDNYIDVYEDAWDEETIEAENDIAGLSISFVVVQVMRFRIGGILPNQEGMEMDATAWSHPYSQSMLLMGSGVAFGLVTVIVMLIVRSFSHKHFIMHRVMMIIQNFCSTGFAWCLFFGTKWAMSYMNFTREESLLRVSMAMVLSFVSFVIIFGLDTIADMDETGDAAEDAIRTIVEALGILVGFSWEQSFDVAVDNCVEGLMPELAPKFNPVFEKLILSVMLAAIVIPSWRLFILPTQQELAKMEKENDQEKMERELRGKLDQLDMLYKDLDTPEQDLDIQYLGCKLLRRKLQGDFDCFHGLKHLKVTEKGIQELKTPYKALKDH